MKITDIHIHHFRNLHEVQYQPATCNVFLGENGSGKTSLLESIYLLSRGKSFRHHQPKLYIEHGYDKTTVFAQLNDEDKVAVQKAQDASTELRLNGQSILTQSPLAQLLPTLLLEPVSLSSLEEGSQTRRELLDWLAFHIEPNFHAEWLAYHRLLKQRNALLKQVTSIDYLTHLQHEEVRAWNHHLGEHAKAIHQYRENILAVWQTHLAAHLHEFLPHYASHMRLRYSPGYDTALALADILDTRLAADIEVGYTRMGCHRADINVVLDLEEHSDERVFKQTLAASDVLSRGEKKLLMTALRLSQLPLLAAAGKVPLVLLDDITAELDERALTLLLTGLKQVNSQLFITSLSTDIVPMIQDIWQESVKIFEIQDGQLTLI